MVPGPQASHRHRVSYQTLHILFFAHDSRLRNCDLVLMHACMRHASARLASFIDQFIASLDQRLYKLISYWLVSLAAFVAGQHYSRKSYWQLPRHSLIRTKMISTIHQLTSCVTLPCLLIGLYSKTMSEKTSVKSYFCTNWLLIRCARHFSQCCDRAKNVGLLTCCHARFYFFILILLIVVHPWANKWWWWW